MIQVSETLRSEVNSKYLNELIQSFSIDIKVEEKDLDGFGHVNNANYIQWLDQVHWMHLAHMGIAEAEINEFNWGFVVRDTTATYLAPLLEEEIVQVGTSITEFDERFRMTRKFQLVRLRDNTTVLQAEIKYVSVDLKKGTPKRVPSKLTDKILSFIGQS